MPDTHTQVYATVTAAWTWDRRYDAGEIVTMTRAQFDYFSTAMPGLLILTGDAPQSDTPDPLPAKTTKRKTDDGE